MLKSMAMALPSYAMSVCKLPKKLCQERDGKILVGSYKGGKKDSLDKVG